MLGARPRCTQRMPWQATLLVGWKSLQYAVRPNGRWTSALPSRPVKSFHGHEYLPVPGSGRSCGMTQLFCSLSRHAYHHQSIGSFDISIAFADAAALCRQAPSLLEFCFGQ